VDYPFETLEDCVEHTSEWYHQGKEKLEYVSTDSQKLSLKIVPGDIKSPVLGRESVGQVALKH
jgi:hypothetical protein